MSEESKHEALFDLMSSYLSNDVNSVQRSIVNHVEYTLASTRFDFDVTKAYYATSHSVRDRLIEHLNDTSNYFDEQGMKRCHYLSLEFLMGRSLQNALINLDIETNYRSALYDLGFNIEDIYEAENDAALGNGGLGRLAACFLDSIATLDLPGWGYGIRYTYGIFRQLIVNGEQIENPDYWLTFGNPWEIERSDVKYEIGFYGHVEDVYRDGVSSKNWVPGLKVLAVAYDNPIPGYKTKNTINLRLWKSKPCSVFDLSSFNRGDYHKAVEQSQTAETITSVLYPADSSYNGKELRLKQQYFFVSATLQDVVQHFKTHNFKSWSEFPLKHAVQLNDTHPAIGIPELMRILMDNENVPYDQAWDITTKTFGYTNHTVLPEALETWSVDLIGRLLPRHLQIVEVINWNFMQFLSRSFPNDLDLMRDTSILLETFPKKVRMANLAIIGSHAVNGVAEIHSKIIRESVFPQFYKIWPDKFLNKTNGVTPRRWMLLANPLMSDLITNTLQTDQWPKDLTLLSGLRSYCEDPEIMSQFYQVKQSNKQKLVQYIKDHLGIDVSVQSLFDVHVKRIHEYKRQLMNILYCCYRYLTIKDMQPADRQKVVPRVTIFGGKAAPSYITAKKIIQFINTVGSIINNDKSIGDLYKVIFLPNYNVSLAELIIPASDLSQHISTAGTEASGTSNMKFAMNGALIIGTKDGANIEIADNIGEENIFYFGAESKDIPHLLSEMRSNKLSWNGRLIRVFQAMESGTFGNVGDCRYLLDSLRNCNDNYLINADFEAYVKAQELVDVTYSNKQKWVSMSIQSVSGMGFFSTDRTINEYAEQIWNIKPAPLPEPTDGEMSRVRSFPNFDPNKFLPKKKE